MADRNIPTERRNAEPCYCRRCKGKRSAPCPHKVRHFWRMIWCWLSGYHFDPAIDRENRCKRCGTQVTL